MFDITPQERLALVVLALLLAGGAIGRHVAGRGDRMLALKFSSEGADTLNPGSAPGLRSRVEEEISEARARSRPLDPGERIDPNRASAVELDRLPGIGPALADRIVEHRASHGNFRSIDDLGGVPGIGDAMLQRIAPHVPLGRGLPSRSAGATTLAIDVNRASAGELQELPGIGPALAKRIVDHRAANGPFRKWEDLESVSGIGPRLRERVQAVARLGP